MDLKDYIRGIPDFPKPGILFYDISTLLRHEDAWQVAMGRMARAVRAHHVGDEPGQADGEGDRDSGHGLG